MDTNFDNILVFATNIKTESEKRQVSKILDENSEILQWSIDQEDIDCVLRIVSDKLSIPQIIKIINTHNFHCAELE